MGNKDLTEKILEDYNDVFADKRKYTDYIPKDKTTIKHVDAVLKLLSAMTKDKRYESVLSDGKEVETMCEVAEKLEQKGKTEGKAEGKAEIIKNMIKDGMAIEKIAQLANVEISLVQELKEKSE